MIRLLVVVLLAFFMFDASSAGADLCQDQRIVTEIRKFEPPADTPFVSMVDRCLTKTVAFRDLNGKHDIEIAWVLRDATRDYDAVVTRYDAFALLPRNELLSLGRFRAVPIPSGSAVWHILDALDINAAFAGGIVRIPFDLFYDSALERRGDELCVAYTMKGPFHGAFLDCNGYDRPVGEIGYAKGTVSWDEARKISCRKLQLDTGKTCNTPYIGPVRTLLVRDEVDGSLYWETELRSLVYRVDLVGGKATLLQR
jgi:hypothetical protein